MILTGAKIHSEWVAGNIHIEPFEEKRLGPNSYDLTLGPKILLYDHPSLEIDEIKMFETKTRTARTVKTAKYKHGRPFFALDSVVDNKTTAVMIPDDGFLLQPETLYLGHTAEEAGSESFVPMIEGRSSFARLGLQVHQTGGFGDVGFTKQWTLEFTVTHPLIIYAGQRIAQIFFSTPDGPINLYKGKYLSASGVEGSKLHTEDFSTAKRAHIGHGGE